ncbi:hypothetical protein ACQZ6A_06720 [Agrobacterium vitis]
MRQDVAEEILRLMESFGTASARVSPETLATMIEIAGEYPITRIRRVVSRFERGEVDGQSLAFPPSTALWAIALRAEKAIQGEPGFETVEQYRKRIVEENRAEIVRHDPATRERIRAILNSFHAKRAEGRLNHDR